jgi:hypothetical protein
VEPGAPTVVTLQDAFLALWPILTAFGGGYLALLGIIYKLLADSIARLERENAELRAEVKEFKAPLDSIADTSQEMNRTLREVLDGILPRGPRGRDR